MKRSFLLLFRALTVALIVCFIVSCKKANVKKVEVDNQFAISLFSDTIKISDLLNSMDSTSSQFLKIHENGDIYAYYSDSIKDIVTSNDIFGNIDDVTFESDSEFEIPTIPPMGSPTTFELPLDNIFSIPFEYEGYGINSVELKSGMINLNIFSNLSFINMLSLSTDNIIHADGSTFNVTIELDSSGSQNIVIDLTNSSIIPTDGSIVFSAILSLEIPAEGLGGIYNFSISGSITDIEFKSINGSIQEMEFGFRNTSDFNINIPNLYGDLSISTPELDIRYINSFGLSTQGTLDSLYLTDELGNKIGLTKDWDKIELLLQSTGESYGSINDIENQLVDNIDILKNYKGITIDGNIVFNCDNASSDIITENSHIDLVTEINMPLELNISNLSYIDTLDFNLNLGSNENNGEGLQVGSVFDLIEFKFIFENKLPLQINLQAYMMDDGIMIDSLFDSNTYIHGHFGGELVKDILMVKIEDEALTNIQNADQLLLNIGLSSLNNDVVINANDYFNLKIGLRTEVSEIYTEDFNF